MAVSQSLNISDLSLLVQDVLGAIEVAVLPTTEQGNNMVVSGWQESKVFADTGEIILVLAMLKILVILTKL
jgi:hypothetical protein